MLTACRKNEAGSSRSRGLQRHHPHPPHLEVDFLLRLVAFVGLLLGETLRWKAAHAGQVGAWQARLLFVKFSDPGSLPVFICTLEP